MNPAGRPLAEVIDADAPIPTRRAAAITLALARELRRVADRGPLRVELRAEDVTVYADGSVRVRPPSHPTATGAVGSLGAVGSDGSDGSGAAIGRLFFELLVGRAPLDRTDAFEPALTNALSPTVCALIARSCSPADGQWPTIDEWSTALVALAGGQATSPTPSERRRARLRRLLVGLGMTVLVVVTLLVVLRAPDWWDTANDDGGATTTVPQP